jgi:nitrile hydratase accessory protein
VTTIDVPKFEGQPDDADGPVFGEVWQAQAFAMVIALHERGLFEWPEWTATLSEEIKAAQLAGDPDTGSTYYQHWLRALERLVVEKGLATCASLMEVSRAWQDAARATPHGQPIVLGKLPELDRS